MKLIKLSLTFLNLLVPFRYMVRKVYFQAKIGLLKSKLMIRKSKQGMVNDDAKSDYKSFVQPPNLTANFLQSAYAKNGITKTEAEITKVKEAYQLFYEITYQIWARDKINKNELIKN